ncbi:MAG TPA: septation protein A [Janthinobacterium sp.]|jgi:intracellular septation protein|nr:septation protein A [Janthinobacterium sp.]
MKFLFDLIPVILFFAVFKWGEGHQDAAHALVSHYMGSLISGGTVQAPQSPILLATIVLCLATLAQIAYLLVRGKKVDGLLWASALIMALFGGLTIYFHDEDFIKWKPTILYWFFAGSLLVGQLVFKKNLIRKAMEAQIKLPDVIWGKLNLVWTAFFAFLGLLNLFVAFVVFKADTGAWVSFKLFGITAIFFIFIVGQTMFLSKYMLEEDA